MKKLLVFGYTMQMGGAEKALLNILNILVKHYEIDLVLIKAQGILMKDIPQGVNVIEIRKNIFDYALFRFIPYFRRKKIRKITNKNYEYAIAFMEGRAATWLTDMKSDCHKIAWIHNDVSKFDIGISEKEIINTYSKVDKIIVVSKQSRDSFIEKYNINSDKIQVIYNLIDENDIINKSKKEKVEKAKFTFINVAKMRYQKRHDRLLEAAAILKNEGYDFNLWLIGNGPLENDVKNKIEELNLNDCVTLYGLKENPFPYIKASDFFVMSSDHEGYPLSLLESLILKTPVISTDVSGAREILKEKYGFICDISLDGLVNAMRNVLENKDEQISIIKQNLNSYMGANGNIKRELNSLFKIK